MYCLDILMNIFLNENKISWWFSNNIYMMNKNAN